MNNIDSKTLETYYGNQLIYSQSGFTAQDVVFGENKADAIYWSDQNGELFLVWKKPEDKKEYLYWGALSQAEIDKFLAD